MVEPMNRSGVQPFGAFTSAQADVCRYEPGFERETKASQTAGSGVRSTTEALGEVPLSARLASFVTCLGIQLASVNRIVNDFTAQRRDGTPPGQSRR
jgi:hypothetical protein